MQKFFFAFFLASICFICVFSALKVSSKSYPPFDTYIKEWEKVDSLDKAALPKSALEEVLKIYAKAKQEDNSPQIIKAIIHRMKYKMQVNEDGLLESIGELENEIPEAKFPVKPLLQSMLAECYWNYYLQNRYKFLNRSTTIDAPGNDISTWDLSTLEKKITSLHEESLQNSNNLKQFPLEIYDAILTARADSKVYRPTLFDFIAHRALAFYVSGERGVTLSTESGSENEFTLSANTGFLPPSSFISQVFTTDNQEDLRFKALLLYQQLIRLHLNDEEMEPLAVADLERMKFVYNNCTTEDKEIQYGEALKKMLSRYRNSAFSGQIAFEYASFIRTSYTPTAEEVKNGFNKNVEALKIAQTEVDRYHETEWTKNCEKLIHEITMTELSGQIQYSIKPGAPSRFFLKHRNIKTLYAMVFRRQYLSDMQEYNPVAMNTDSIITGKLFVQKFKFDLKDSANQTYNDYEYHSSVQKLDQLDKGYYELMLSEDSNFNIKKQTIGLRFWSTEITMVSIADNSKKTIQILNPSSGKPIANAKITLYKTDWNSTKQKYDLKKGLGYISDANGWVRMPYTNDYYDYFMRIGSGTEEFYPPYNVNLYYRYQEKDESTIKTFLFTDRGIYRPGQTIYFKGIMVKSSDKGHKNEIVPNKTDKVILYDANNQKISELTLTTNEYGSFSGNFTAPIGVLTGNMHISNENGTVNFSVEEYKRPKFEVAYKPVTGSYKLNEIISVTGYAKAFAGNPVDNAQIKYRVVRRRTYQNWYYGYYPPEAPKEIMHGAMTSNDEGEFEIKFEAKPDPTADKQYNPQFVYTVSADVTDLNGETRSAETSVTVGYAAIVGNISVPEFNSTEQPLNFHISIKNLNGLVEKSKGTIVIEQLKTSDRILRTNLFQGAGNYTHLMSKEEFEKDFPNDGYNDEDLDNKKPVLRKVLEKEFNTHDTDVFKVDDMRDFSPGRYVVTLKVKDKYGVEISDKHYFTVYKTKNGIANELPYPSAYMHIQPISSRSGTNSFEPGEIAHYTIGSSYNDVRVLYKLMMGEKVISENTITINNEFKNIDIPILETYRGGIAIRVFFLKDYRTYELAPDIKVPYSNKELKLEFLTFRNKMLPGSKEQWSVKVSGKNTNKVMAEMMATMYDASLDKFRNNEFSLNVWPTNYSLGYFSSECLLPVNDKNYTTRQYDTYFHSHEQQFDQLNWFGVNFHENYGTKRYGLLTYEWESSGQKNIRYKDVAPNFLVSGSSTFSNATSYLGFSDRNVEITKKVELGNVGISPDNDPSKQKENKQAKKSESEIIPRKNFNESAYFIPQIHTNEKGEIIFSFTMPESLTRWKFMALAHTKDLASGLLNASAITQKDLMVVPNPPRFFRENDEFVFQSKISNISAIDLDGDAAIQFFDALTMLPLKNISTTSLSQKFHCAKGQSTVVNWTMHIPNGIEAINYKIIAKAGNFSDGEEAALPVLSDKIMVIESMPLPVRGGESKNFDFTKLINSGNSNTLQHYKLTLEFTSNPAWYAVQSLPYLMEYPYECAEQTFNRYYANMLSKHIAESDPRIRNIFNLWKAAAAQGKSQALLSNLEKNQELKSLLLEETPYVLQGKNESERKQRIGLLFDEKAINKSTHAALFKLKQMQFSDGGWGWFKGMPSDRYISQYIATGFGKLAHLKVINNEKRMITGAVQFLDLAMNDAYNNLIKNKVNLHQNNLNGIDIQYLYMRSFFTDIQLEEKYKTAFDYYKVQAQKYWNVQGIMQKGMIALALKRMNDLVTPKNIMKSISEYALHNDEMGMYWKENSGGYFWYQAPVETQSLLIEAYDEVLNDQKSVDDMKVWLLKQKQVQDWKTTKATADACYALMLRGINFLAEDRKVEITLGDLPINPNTIPGLTYEPGTGYIKTSWSKAEVKPDFGKIKIVNPNKVVSWGALHWQYFEQMDKITPHETPLKLNRKLYIVRPSSKSPVIEEVKEGTVIKIGDLIKVRIELRVDRDMEYIHMKDMRASGFEPVNVLSQYKWQGGIGYYEATKDAATNFFISNLPKGTYVFEYSLRANNAGVFSHGITTIQSMYAPEYNSHSEGMKVKIGM